MNPSSSPPELLFDLLTESGALRFGTFRLKSGASSPFFIDLGRVSSGPHLARLGSLLAGALAYAFPQADVLFGPPYKGIALAAATALSCWSERGWRLETSTCRKESKGHGEGGWFIGREPTTGDQVVIIDDVLSSGGTKIEAANLLRESCGVEPLGVLVTVDRRPLGAPPEPGLPRVHALATLQDLSGWLLTRDPERAELVQRFLAGQDLPGVRS